MEVGSGGRDKTNAIAPGSTRKQKRTRTAKRRSLLLPRAVRPDRNIRRSERALLVTRTKLRLSTATKKTISASQKAISDRSAKAAYRCVRHSVKHLKAELKDLPILVGVLTEDVLRIEPTRVAGQFEIVRVPRSARSTHQKANGKAISSRLCRQVRASCAQNPAPAACR